MSTTDQSHGYGKFEETAHELEQAAAERAELTQKAGTSGIDALSAAIRARPVSAMLMACTAGYLLGWLRRG